MHRLRTKDRQISRKSLELGWVRPDSADLPWGKVSRMDPTYIDLHMHSFYSDDGEFSPSELVAMCKASGIRILALSDHNSVGGVLEAQRAATEAGLLLLPAIEIDCTYRGAGLHVLGYGIDIANPNWSRMENEISEQSVRASKEMLAAVRALGFDLTEKDMLVAAAGRKYPLRWPGELFAEVLLAAEEYRTHPLLIPYREGNARADNPYVNFYWDFCSEDKPCHVAMRYPVLEEVLALIHESGGSAVLAHPGISLRGKDAIFRELLRSGIDGVEAWSGYHDADTADRYYAEATAAGLWVSKGSDFHGRTKPSIRIGQTETRVSDRVIEEELLRAGLL